MKVLAVYSIKGGVGKTAMAVNLAHAAAADGLAFMLDRRKALHLSLLEDLPGESKARFCRTVIPVTSEIEKMGIEREPVACFAPRSPGARAVDELWREIREGLAL